MIVGAPERLPVLIRRGFLAASSQWQFIFAGRPVRPRTRPQIRQTSKAVLQVPTRKFIVGAFCRIEAAHVCVSREHRR